MQKYGISSQFHLHSIVSSEAQLSDALEELKAANLEMTTRCDSLAERFNKEKDGRMVRTLTILLFACCYTELRHNFNFSISKLAAC